MTAAMQVVFRPCRSGERPRLLVAPLVGAHDKDLHGRFGRQAVVRALQPVIEPAQLHALDVSGETGRSHAEGKIALNLLELAVTPRSYDELLPASGRLRLAAIAQRSEGL